RCIVRRAAAARMRHGVPRERVRSTAGDPPGPFPGTRPARPADSQARVLRKGVWQVVRSGQHKVWCDEESAAPGAIRKWARPPHFPGGRPLARGLLGGRDLLQDLAQLRPAPGLLLREDELAVEDHL